MTEAVQVALVVATPPTVVAISALILGLRADARARKADVISGRKLDHITVLTNSTLSAANKRIEELEEVVRRLVTQIEERNLSS